MRDSVEEAKTMCYNLPASEAGCPEVSRDPVSPNVEPLVTLITREFVGAEPVSERPEAEVPRRVAAFVAAATAVSVLCCSCSDEREGYYTW